MAVEDRFEDEVNKARYEYSRDLETGQKIVVGVNAFREEDEVPNINIFRLSSTMPARRRAYVKNFKKNRDKAKAKKALDELMKKAREKVNLFIPISNAVEAGATLGEISDTLREAENFKINIVGG